MALARFSLRSSAPVIGLMSDYLDDDYHQVVISGALAAARDSGLRLVCFLGGQLELDAPGAPRQHTFELIGPESVDALIVMSGALINAPGLSGLASYIERYRGLPMVSVATRLFAEVPTVTVDNSGGIRRAVTHLIRDHELRALAFVCGPDANEEAAQRLATFRSVLAEHGLPVQEELILPGGFTQPSGAAAVRLLFGQRAVKPAEVDGIVAANDSSAIGVMQELAHMGIRVPEQVAVVGFDNVDDGRYTNPPLTTVYQPLREQGREAVRLALAAFRGEATSDVALRTELVARRSCGCFPHDIRPIHAVQAGHGFEAALIERRQRLLAELARAAQGRFGALPAQWEARLVNAFAEGVRDAPERFVQVADDMVRALGDSGADLGIFQEVLSVLRRELLPCLSGDAMRRVLGEALLDEVRRLTALASERREARGRLDAMRYGAEFVSRSAQVSASFQPGWLHEHGLPALVPLGIGAALVARYVGEGQVVEVVASTIEGIPLAQRSKARDLVRTVASLTAGCCVSSLFCEDRLLGFAVFELGARAGFGYEALRGIVSSALEGLRLRQRLLELEALAARGS